MMAILLQKEASVVAGEADTREALEEVPRVLEVPSVQEVPRVPRRTAITEADGIFLVEAEVAA